MSNKQTLFPEAQAEPIITPVSDSNVSLAELCTQGKLEELKRRIQIGASCEELDNGNYLTHTAALANQFEVLKWLLHEKKMGANLLNSANKSVLQIAIQSKHVDTITWLAKNERSLTLQVTVENLCEAIQTKELEIVKPIAEVVGAVYDKSSIGQTPLELARNQNTPEIVKYLENKTLFHILSDNVTELEIVQKLEHLLGDQNKEFFNETAQKAFENDSTSTESNEPKVNAVMLAAEKRYMRVVKWLVEKGANPNSESESGNRLLGAIKWNHDPENFKWLVNHGAEINSRNDSGKFALEKYVDQDNLDVIRWSIKEKKFDVYENNDNGLNLLTTIIQKGKLNIFKAIVEECLIDVNKKLSDANTLLHVAVVSAKTDIVKKLIEAKATINIENLYGKTPIDIALNMKNDLILDLLVVSYAINNIRATDIDEDAKIDNFKKFLAKYNNQHVQERVREDEMINAAKNLKWDKLAQFLKADKTALSVEGQITQSFAPKPKEYNVLLIGETGVGKSTFINAFPDYLSFANLDEAIKAGDAYCLSPTNFAISDENYEEHVIKCGDFANNKTSIAGQSSTQTVKSYSMTTENVILRLIDTPGIGYTGELERDQENFDKLLKAVAELESIHAICVMLKPNNSQLTVVFEYCIRELFSHLDKSASQNIVFLFTNSRGTFYRPGDTIWPLRTILKDLESPPTSVKIPFEKKNVFCTDNEAFKFLIAKQKGVVFGEDEVEDFANSWNKSAQVCRDFVKYLIKLTPHRIQESTTINAARRIVLSLSEPLVEIAKHIGTTTMYLQEKKQFIECNKQDFRCPNISVPSIKIQFLKVPFTGCLHKDCAHIVEISGMREEIPRICHYPCREEIEANKKGHTSIERCSVMSIYCGTCTHHFSDHIHLYYLKKIVNEELKDTDCVEKLKRQLEDVSNQYKSEEGGILSALAKFSHFLKHNSIIVFHDSCNDYIQELIDKEEKLGDLSNKILLDIYKTILTKYQKYFNDLENEFDRVKKPIVTSTDIFSEINKLKNLGNFGKTIGDIADAGMGLLKEDVFPDVQVKLRTGTLTNLLDSVE